MSELTRLRKICWAVNLVYSNLLKELVNAVEPLDECSVRSYKYDTRPIEEPGGVRYTWLVFNTLDHVRLSITARGFGIVHVTVVSVMFSNWNRDVAVACEDEVDDEVWENARKLIRETIEFVARTRNESK